MSFRSARTASPSRRRRSSRARATRATAPSRRRRAMNRSASTRAVCVNVGWLKTSCDSLHRDRVGGDEIRRRQRVQEPARRRTPKKIVPTIATPTAAAPAPISPRRRSWQPISANGAITIIEIFAPRGRDDRRHPAHVALGQDQRDPGQRGQQDQHVVVAAADLEHEQRRVQADERDGHARVDPAALRQPPHEPARHEAAHERDRLERPHRARDPERHERVRRDGEQRPVGRLDVMPLDVGPDRIVLRAPPPSRGCRGRGRAGRSRGRSRRSRTRRPRTAAARAGRSTLAATIPAIRAGVRIAPRHARTTSQQALIAISTPPRSCHVVSDPRCKGCSGPASQPGNAWRPAGTRNDGAAAASTAITSDAAIRPSSATTPVASTSAARHRRREIGIAAAASRTPQSVPEPQCFLCELLCLDVVR